MGPKTLTAEELACLASPARNEVFMQLRTLGQASIGDVARVMGRKPETVHYHVKALLAAGLVREAFRRPGIKKPEAVYESVGAKYRLPSPAKDAQIAGLIRKSVAAGLRQTTRGFLAAAKAAETSPETQKLLDVVRLNARLSPEDARELMRRIGEVVKFADEHRQEDGVRLVWSSLLYPAKV